jgi:7-carboxy-7-deazaguanine synthase
VSDSTFPVVEVFGPTVQGEGPLAGTPTFFVRVGLCDYRCSWCDSMYAVEPSEVKANAERLTAEETVERVMALPLGPQWVTVSGGNPAIHDLAGLRDLLRDRRLLVAVETQASRWHEWLASVDMLVCSPKPPSSGMVSEKHTAETSAFLDEAEKRVRHGRRALKIVVFDEPDLEWATRMVVERDGWRCYLSAGTPIPNDDPIDEILARYRWLCERVAVDMRLRHVAALPQLHVLAWGQTRGV